MDVPKDAQKDFVNVMDSCVEGFTGEWDCTTPEGREGFEAMYDGLVKFAESIGMNVSKARDWPGA